MNINNQLQIEREVKLHNTYNPQASLMFEIPCNHCNGRGWFAYDMMADSTHPCKVCSGTGLTKDAFTNEKSSRT